MRIIGIVGILLLLVPAVFAGEQEPTSSLHAKPKLTLAGDTALLTVAVRPEKSADFEQVISKMKAALLQSDDPKRREQPAGVEGDEIEKHLPDGNLAYVHVIQPVVPGADYAVMQTLYDAFPDERQALYELYRGAFVQNLSLATGHIVVDMSKAP